jgi:phosphatidate cytidylyltransferase
MLIICLLAVDEFHRLVESPRSLRIYTALSAILLWLVAAFYSYPWMPALALAYVALLVVCAMDEIWNLSGQPLKNWGTMFISQFMVAMPLCTLLLLERLDKWLLMALFVLIWVNDTGAYCVGTLTAKRPQGNHKMTPHISPKKSWEGLIGGVVFCLAASYILALCGWYDVISTSGHTMIIATLFAVFTSLFGTMGDLMESLFKRSIGVKDSGRFLPGHGGVLDRFDSILLASPILTAFCWLCYFLAPLL